MVAAPVGERAKVLYILGTTRSGSTILERVLGAVPGAFAAGEVHWMWRGMQAGFVCGCGQPVQSCEVWAPILARAAAGGRLDPDDVIEMQREARFARTGRLLRRRSWRPTGRERLDRYVDVLARLHAAIGAETGAALVIDSSKSPAVAAILANLPQIDLWLVHLVRDPRAFAYSWRRGKPRDDAPGGGYQPGAIRCAVRWVVTNHWCERACRLVPRERSMVVRYEDFVARPREVAASIMALAGEPAAGLPFVADDTAVLGPGHTASGNRSRFRVGEVQLRLDEAWARARRDPRRALVTVLTAPWLARYGYRPEVPRP